MVSQVTLSSTHLLISKIPRVSWNIFEVKELYEFVPSMLYLISPITFSFWLFYIFLLWFFSRVIEFAPFGAPTQASLIPFCAAVEVFLFCIDLYAINISYKAAKP